MAEQPNPAANANDPAAAAAQTPEAKAAAEAAAAAAAKAKDATPAAEATPSSLMDEATAEEKAAQEAENKRLLETPEKDLSDEDKVAKAALIKANADAEKAKGVPEKYEFKVPEGMELNQEYADKASAIMKKHGITQAAATELGELAAAQLKQINEAIIKTQADNFNKFVDDLKAETIKTLGANYKQELAFAAKSRDRFASPELVEKLNLSGLANDKDMIALFIKIGRAISEDKMIEGKGALPAEQDALKVLYDAKT